MMQQRRIEILYHKFQEIFRGIIPEKYRYFSGKILQEISWIFWTPNPSYISHFVRACVDVSDDPYTRLNKHDEIT